MMAAHATRIDPAPEQPTTASAPHSVVGKPKARAYQILDDADDLGWKAGLTGAEWLLLRTLILAQGRNVAKSRQAWGHPLSIAVTTLADGLKKSVRQVGRIRKSLEDKQALHVVRGHGNMPGKRAQAAQYVVSYSNLERPFGEVNPTPAYEAAMALADDECRGNVRVPVRVPVRANGGLSTEPNLTEPSSFETPTTTPRAVTSSTRQEEGEIQDGKQGSVGANTQTKGVPDERNSTSGQGTCERDVLAVVQQILRDLNATDPHVSIPPKQIDNMRPNGTLVARLAPCVDSGTTPEELRASLSGCASKARDGVVRSVEYFARGELPVVRDAGRRREQDAHRRKLEEERRKRNEASAAAKANAVGFPDFLRDRYLGGREVGNSIRV